VTTLDAIVRRGAANNPDRPAIADAHAAWTWSEFDAQVTRGADALRAAGIGPGDRVAAVDYNSSAYFALYFAAARLGAVISPVSYLSAPAEIRHVLSDYDPKLVIVGEEFRERFAGVTGDAAPAAQRLGFGEWAQAVAAADAGASFPEPDPEALFRVLYTSGTTGLPKGVCHSQQALYLDGLMTAIGYRLTCADSYVVHAPSFHAASWDHAKLFQISDGRIVVIPRFEPVALMDAVSRHKTTVLFGVPAVLRLLLHHPRWAEFDLSSVRLVYFGGALGAASVLDEFARAIGREIDLMQIYGLTEGGPFVSVAPPEIALSKPASIGRSIPGVEMGLVDPETGARVTGTGVGEIVVRSPTNMLGYWRNPAATALALRDGWLHTGDLGQRDADGDYTIVDRLKDMVRSGGENVYAAEVERVLLAHPGVAEAAVVGLPDPRWDERVTAVVVRAAGAALGAEEVREHCRAQLAAYKVPKQVEFVDELPKTGLGKISKHELRARLLRGAAA
jgi:fatty-acyl-CoA synthase